MFKGTFLLKFFWFGMVFVIMKCVSTKIEISGCWRIQFGSVLRLLNLRSVKAKKLGWRTLDVDKQASVG